MRNVFDQYTQPENKLTHALVCTLDSDRALLRPFLRWAGAKDVPPEHHLSITEQQLPGDFTIDDNEEDGDGLPDAAFFTDDGWLFLIEAKVQSPIGVGQLQRHRSTAIRKGFGSPQLALLTVDPSTPSMSKHAVHREWSEVYAWFRYRAKHSEWAQRFTEYMEILEARMIAKEYAVRGTLTKFDGLRFDDDHPYTYREAKRLIRLLGDKLQPRKDLHQIGVDPNGDRRNAITGRSGSRVWDFLPLEAARNATSFTAYPHLTMGINRDNAVAAITVPNGVKGGFRTKLKELGEEGFFDLLREIENTTRATRHRSVGARTVVYAIQRHFLSQRSSGSEDARLEADVRTVVKGKRRDAKYQPQWASAIYSVLTNKRSNIQFGAQTHFSYECPIIRSAEATDLFAETWLALSPLLDLVLDD